MAGHPMHRPLVLLACLAVVVVAVNSALRPARGGTPAVRTIEHELSSAVALKLSTEGFNYPIAVSCAPPPGGAPPDPTAVHLVCQVTAFNKRRPSKSPVWVEDVTCNLLVPSGTPRCGSSGGDALR